MIDNRKRMHMVSTLNTAMCEKQVRRRKTGRLSQQPSKRNSSRAARIRLDTSPLKKKKKIPKRRRRRSATRCFLRKCQPPACQRFPGGIERQEGKGAMSGQEDWNHREDGPESNCGHGRSKNRAVLYNVWRQKARVPRKVRAHCSIARLAKRREGLGVQRLADLDHLPHAG